jgi:hypothetical protein
MDINRERKNRLAMSLICPKKNTQHNPKCAPKTLGFSKLQEI